MSLDDNRRAAATATNVRDTLVAACGWLTRLTEGAAALLLLAVVVINLIGVFFRFVVVDPIGWTEEGMRYAVVWATFLAASAALWRGEHMVLNVLGAVPSALVRRAAHIMALLAIVTFCAVISWEGYQLAWRNWGQVSPVMQLPMLVPYIAVSVGCTLMGLKALVLLFLPIGFHLDDTADEATAVRADVDPADT